MLVYVYMGTVVFMGVYKGAPCSHTLGTICFALGSCMARVILLRPENQPMANHDNFCVECEVLKLALKCSESKCGNCCDEPSCPAHGSEFCEDCGNDWDYCECEDDDDDDWDGVQGEFEDDYGDVSPQEQNDFKDLSNEFDMDPDVAYDNLS